jgi:hypothetical protein
MLLAAIDLHQQRFGGQRIGIAQLRLDRFAFLQVVAGNHEVNGFHISIPAVVAP